MVGDKIPITNVTEEYAKADPVYIEKTMVCSPATPRIHLTSPHGELPFKTQFVLTMPPRLYLKPTLIIAQFEATATVVGEVSSLSQSPTIGIITSFKTCRHHALPWVLPYRLSFSSTS